MVSLAFLGDLMLGRGVSAELRWMLPTDCWGSTRPILQSADAVIANLECAITRCTRRWTKTPKVFHFRADPVAIDVLRAGNIRCVTLANNHTLDYGEEGLLETLRYLDMADLDFAGAGHNLAEAEEPALFEAAGLKVAVISLTDNEPAFAAGKSRPGVNYLRIATDSHTLRRLDEWIDRARCAGAQFIVLSPHWGPNMIEFPLPHHIDFAHEAIECGVDLVFGHSAHVFQALEVRDGKPIIFDAGDFLDDYAVDARLRNDWSFIYLVEIDACERRVTHVRMIPVRLTYARVDVAQAAEAEAIRQRMVERCADFGTRLVHTAEGLEVAIGEPAVARGSSA